jgi:hypothetical protein
MSRGARWIGRGGVFGRRMMLQVGGYGQRRFFWRVLNGKRIGGALRELTLPGSHEALVVLSIHSHCMRAGWRQPPE